jgi:hypothetical protein
MDATAWQGPRLVAVEDAEEMTRQLRMLTAHALLWSLVASVAILVLWDRVERNRL